MVPTLDRGAGVAVIAPAGPLPPATYEAGLELLRTRYELRITHGVDEAADATFPYLAASDEARIEAFNHALGDEKVGAILCARGGYGSARILDALDAETLQRRRLPLVGFSDITAIHAWAASHGVPTIHGPVVNQLSLITPEDQQALFELLEGGASTRFAGLQTWRPGKAQGPLFGGNLAVLASLCGTPYLPELTGKILFFEEVNEPAYRLDRYLTQLRQAGVLEGVVGVVVGELTRCEGAAEILERLLTPLGVPIAAGLPAGHGARNRAFWLSTDAELDAGAGKLESAAPARPAANPASDQVTD